MKQSRKKKESYGSNEVKRYLGALSENFTGQVKGIAEQYTDLKKDITEVKENQKSHSEMIGKLMVDMTIVKGDISIIKNDLKQKVDRDEFVLLEKRVLMLEKKN